MNEKAVKGSFTSAVTKIFSAVFMLCLIFVNGENFWWFSHSLFLSVFGFQAFLIPFYLIFDVFFGEKAKKEQKIYCVLFINLLNILFYTVTFNRTYSFWFFLKESFLKFNITGIFGGVFGSFLVWLFGVSGAKVFLVLFLALVLVLFFGVNLIEISRQFYEKLKKIYLKIKNIKVNQHKKKPEVFKINDFAEDKSEISEKESKNEVDGDHPDISRVAAEFLEREKHRAKIEKPKSEFLESVPRDSDYCYPSSDLLNETEEAEQKDVENELVTNSKMLTDTLKSFNVNTRVVDYSRGPAVTRYEIQPDSGVKVSKVTALSDDIALNLAALGVRIEAPIPGKSAIGVEIPNRIVSTVGIREIIESVEFSGAKSKLSVVLGKDIAGKPVVTDISKMPHLLIAGSTGSGKSVCVNSFIVSILYKASPKDVRLVMIDPKVVELGVYNGIPHLYTPVVTDPKKSANALNWAVGEMKKRYKNFEDTKVRDISSYNNFIEKNPELLDIRGNKREKLPRIIIIIDELSDLMMTAPKEIEDYICRLAQMARAAGMHLVIATQRPSVDVITGIIKANVPSRIALAVSSQVDSRTILDMSGAEKLLGRGDMLFSPLGAIKPLRVQGCYVSDEEIERVVNFIKENNECGYDDAIIGSVEYGAGEADDEEEGIFSEDSDPIMKDAIKCVVEAGQASTSLLQRRLRLGYARAGRLIDGMEQMGIVGPHEGSKSRRVLMSWQDFLEMKMRS
jgi:S-DNA-T family DNA segregation ATPase FtsK/SpoIIIE